MQAQPPGPGLPIHEPSVMSWTFLSSAFNGRSGGDFVEFPLEKSIYLIQDLGGLCGLVNFDAQLRSVADAVREISGELFHFADDVGSGAIAQHGIVGPHDVVALGLGGMIVRSSLEIL